MKVKIGCDIVEIKRFNKINKKALDKIFHKSELKSLKPETLAGLFAVKESCKKIFNDLKWHEIEIKKKRNGKPFLIISDKYDKIESQDISISHDKDYAFAVAVFMLKEEV